MIYCIIYFLLNLFVMGHGRCYFPGELQGLWKTQAAPDVARLPIVYSMVNITASHISTWGECHRKIDNNIILAHKSRVRVSPCYRCFRLVVASVNVAALLSSGLESCFLSEKAALASCPTSEGASVHISLYKIPSSGRTDRQETQCPLSGIYHFSYYKGERSQRGPRREPTLRCEQPTSEMSNCPFGFSLRLQYRDCTFERPSEAEWHCLGTWRGLNGQIYTAMWDINARGNDEKPKYKCGIFRHDTSKKKVYLAFSRDSTCINDLFSSQDGHERYVLNEVPGPPLPHEAKKHPCRFASNLLGHWHNLHVRRSTMTFRDEENFETLHMKCLKDAKNKEKYIVYVHNNCGNSFYTCIMLKRRSTNIVEIKIGRKERRLHHGICNSLNIGNESNWVTLAKKSIKSAPSCPIVGTYQGHLPDAPGYCAELYSDCSRTDIMYYAVDECGNRDDFYEQREYRCLGHWKEDGRIYAFTHRTDIHTYECFEGVEGENGIIFLKEAGSSCKRGIAPNVFGMQTTMKAGCPSNKIIGQSSLKDPSPKTRSREIPPTRPPWVPSTTRPWKPITGRPRSSTAQFHPPFYSTLCMILALVILSSFS